MMLWVFIALIIAGIAKGVLEWLRKDFDTFKDVGPGE